MSSNNRHSNPKHGVGRVSTCAAAWLAWSTCALSLALAGLAIGLVFVLNLSHPDESVYAYWIHFTAIAVAFSTVGAIVASHRPRHWVGWLFCMIGFLVAADHFCGEYAIYALMVHPEAFPPSSVLTEAAGTTFSSSSSTLLGGAPTNSSPSTPQAHQQKLNAQHTSSQSHMRGAPT